MARILALLIAVLSLVACSGDVSCSMPSGVYEMTLRGCGLTSTERFDWSAWPPSGCTELESTCTASGALQMRYSCPGQPEAIVTVSLDQSRISGTLAFDGCVYAVDGVPIRTE